VLSHHRRLAAQPPVLWSYHLATARWIRHPLVASAATLLTDITLAALTARLNEQNTDPFETKFALAATGGDSLMLWGGCLERDHVAVRLKLTTDDVARSLAHTAAVASAAHAGAQGPLPLSSRLLSRHASGLGTDDGTARPSPRSARAPTGIVLPLAHHRAMRIASKRRGNALGSFENLGSAAPAPVSSVASGGSGGGASARDARARAADDALSPRALQMPALKLAACPVVRIGAPEQLLAWRRNFYNEQLEWLFGLHARDRAQAAAQESAAKAAASAASSAVGAAGATASAAAAASGDATGSTPRFMRATTRQPAPPPAADAASKSAARAEVDEMRHRRFCPTNIENAALSGVSASVAWPLFSLRSLPPAASVTPAALRWMLVRRFVLSGWAARDAYPSEVTLQGWRDGRLIPPVRSFASLL
jgi:hypothetical protein